MNLADDLIQTAHSCDPAGGGDVHPSYSDDELHLGGCSLDEVAATFGTPLFVVHPAKLLERLAVFRRTFFLAGLHAEVFFSVKTNPLPVILQTLLMAGAGAEVVSEEEYALARRIGYPAGRIIVNGPVKTPALLRRAVDEGAALVNVEGPAELELLRQIVRRRDMAVNVGIRVNPGFRSWRLSAARSTAAAGSAMGFDARGPKLRAALEKVASDRRLRFRGLHAHIGSGISSAFAYARALDRVLEAAALALSVGLRIDVLDLGGGYSISGARTVSARDAIRVMAGISWSKPDSDADDRLLETVIRMWDEKLRRFARTHSIELPTVYVEPGRALSGPAQHLLLTVRRVMELDAGSDVAFCDRGAMSLSPLLLAERHTILPARRRSERSRRYRLTGNLPTPLDLVALRIDLPQLEPGDVLLVRDVGGYFTSTGNTFGGPRPAVAAVDAGRAWLVRRHETLDDLVARDLDALADYNSYGTPLPDRAEPSTIPQIYDDARI